MRKENAKKSTISPLSGKKGVSNTSEGKIAFGKRKGMRKVVEEGGPSVAESDGVEAENDESTTSE